MSLYWYAACDDCKSVISIGSSHASGNFHAEDEGLALVIKHSGHRMRIVAEPDSDTHPDIFDYQKEEPTPKVKP